MSKTIDQKVVQMQFDNQGFEQNAKQTMSTLDKLKAALKFEGANKGVEDLNKSIKGLDFSQAEIMATRAGFHIQDVFLKISNVLEYQIARRIINLSENIAKSLTLDQITAGFNEYQLKMDSVQTIMASTGEKIKVVNGYLEELNHYSDKTIYSFSDMTQNIGKFTNAGVKLEDAVAAIQGVANVAAVSGANANEASRAMYNFAQALSSGFVKLIDWKSIENANMATVEFKETLLETATALNYCKKGSNGMYEVLTKNAQGKTMDQAISATKNFNDSLAYQWMKTDVLTQALEIYSKDVRDMTDAEVEAYEAKLRSAGFTDEQIIKFEELGIKATDAATKVRTFKQLIDAVKEAIGSGWAMSFEYVIGDLEEAKEVLTKINDVVSGIVEKLSSRRNTLLSNWKDRGGRDSLIRSFENIAEAISRVMEVAKQLWYDLFPPTTSKNLYMATKRFELFTKSLIMNKETATKLREALHYLLLPVKILIEAVKFGFTIIVPLVSVLQYLLKIAITFTSALAKAAIIVAKAVYHSEAFQKALVAIKSTISTVWASIKSFVTTVGGELVAAFQDSNSWLWKLIDGLTFLGKISLGAIVTVFNTIANFKFSDVTAGIDKMGAKFKEFVDGLRESAKESKALQFLVDIIDDLKSGFEFLKGVFKTFYEVFSEGLEKVQSFSDLLSLIKDSAEEAFKPIIDFFKEKFLGEEGNVFEHLKNSFQSFIDTLKEGMKNIPWSRVLLVAFCIGLAAAVLQLVNAISKFSLLASALTESIRIVNETVRTFTGIRNRLKELKEIAVFIASITFSIALLSQIPKEELTRAAIVLGAVAGGLMVLAEVMMIINKKSILKPGATSQLFMSLAGLAAGAAILSAAVVALSDLKKTISELLPYIGELGIVMAELIGAMVILSLLGKKLSFSLSAFSALSLVAFAGSVYLLCESLKSLADIDFNHVEDLTQVLIAVLGGFAVITAITGRLKFWSFASLIAIMIGLKNLAPTIQELATIQITDDVKHILELVTQIITIVGIVSIVTTVWSSIVKILRPKRALMNKASSLLGDFSRTILAIGLSVGVMTLAITKLINTIDKLKHVERVKMSLVAAGIIVAGLGVFIVKVSQGGKIFNTHKSGVLKFALAMTLLSTTIVPMVLLVEELTRFLQTNKDAQWYMAEAGLVVGGLITLLGVMMKLTGSIKGVDFKLILAMFGSVTAIVGEIGALALLIYDKNGVEDGLMAAIGILTLVLTELDGALFFLSKMKFDAVSTGPVIAFTAAITALFTGMLIAAAVLDDNDVKRLGDIMLGFIFSVISIAGSFAILSKATIAISWAPILGFAVLIATFAASFIAVGKSLETIDWDHMEEVFNGFVGILALLGGISYALATLNFGYEIPLIITAMAASIVAMAFACKLLEDVDGGKISGTLKEIIATLTELTAIAGIIAVLSYAFPTFLPIMVAATVIIDSLALSIAAVSASMALLNLGVAALAYVFSEHLTPALIEIGENSETVEKAIKVLVDGVVYAIDEISKSIAKGIVVIAYSTSEGVSGIIISTANSISQGMIIIGSTLATGVDLVWEQLKSKITEKFPFLKKHGEESGDNFKDGLNSSESLLVSAAKGILDSILGALGGGIGDFFSMGASLVGALIDGFNSKDGDKYVETKVESATAGVEAKMEGKAKTLYKKQANIEAGVVGQERRKSAEDFNKYLDYTFLPKAKKADREINIEIQEESKSTWQKVTDLMKGAANSSVSDWEIFGHKVGDVWDKAKEGGTNFINTITGYMDPSTWTGDFLNYEEILKQIEETQKEAEDAAKNAGAGFEGAGKSASKGAKGVKELNDEMSQYVEKMEGSFNILDEFDLGMDEENPLTGDKLLQNMQSNIDGMNTWASEMVAIAAKVPTGLYKKLADMGPTGYKYVHAFAEMTEDQLMQVAQIYAQSLTIPTSVTQQIYGGMAETAFNAYSGFVNGLNIPQIQQDGINMANSFLDGLQGPDGMDTHSPSKKTFKIGIYVTEGLSNGMEDPAAMDLLHYKILHICTDILRRFRLGLPVKDYISIGGQVTEGLKRGILNGQKDVEDAVTKVCEAASKTCKVVLEIESPSKVFHRFGKFIDEGLADGVTDNLSKVENSVSGLASATIDNMRGAIESIQAVVDSDMDIEPVISPVVDLRNVQNGAKSINSLMGLNFGSDVTMPAASFMTSSQLVNMSDNTDVVMAVTSLKDDIGSLKKAMTNIKMVLDTGTVVGALTPMIDKEIGVRTIYAGRGI